MSKKAFLIAAFTLIAACERPGVPPEEIRTERTEQFLVLQGFGPNDSVTVDSQGYRVGLYHDFSSYDSLRIQFSAINFESTTTPGSVIVRIGPSLYLTTPLHVGRNNITIRIDCAELQKPRLSALTFYSAGTESRVVLAGLRVFGWGPAYRLHGGNELPAGDPRHLTQTKRSRDQIGWDRSEG